jgi:hypothetical protein
MLSGTVLIGLTKPGITLPCDALWQRLNFRPLPHQQGSFDLTDLRASSMTAAS